MDRGQATRTNAAETILERRDSREIVRRCIEKFPDKYRSVLLLRDIEELDTDETARSLATPRTPSRCGSTGSPGTKDAHRARVWLPIGYFEPYPILPSQLRHLTLVLAQMTKTLKLFSPLHLPFWHLQIWVRVSELTKLRDLQDPEVNQILTQSMADEDLRVKLKAIDILGARQANAAVAAMSSMLFLRSTEQIVKLHLVSELGRIGDAQGTLPILQFMAELQDKRGCGTAVFALGEI